MPEVRKVEFESGTAYLGNCLNILPQLDRNAVEIAVTSPPYNLCTRYANYTSTETSKAFTEKLEDWYDDDMPEWLYQGFQQSVIHEMLRVCRSSVFYNHRVRYAWHSRNIYRTPNNIHHPMHWLEKFPIWCEIIWDRRGIGNPTRRYHSQDERIYQIGKPKKWDNEEGFTTIWSISPSQNEGHVCTFPLELVERALLPTTEKGDVILDPFAGVGTSALAAIRHGRKFVMIEKDPTYFETMCEKIREAETQGTS